MRSHVRLLTGARPVMAMPVLRSDFVLRPIRASVSRDQQDDTADALIVARRLPRRAAAVRAWTVPARLHLSEQVTVEMERGYCLMGERFICLA